MFDRSQLTETWLSPQEAEVGRLLCEGIAPKEIAVRLEISYSTVRMYIYERLAPKLEAKGKLEVVVRLLQNPEIFTGRRVVLRKPPASEAVISGGCPAGVRSSPQPAA